MYSIEDHNVFAILKLSTNENEKVNETFLLAYDNNIFDDSEIIYLVYKTFYGKFK